MTKWFYGIMGFSIAIFLLMVVSCKTSNLDDGKNLPVDPKPLITESKNEVHTASQDLKTSTKVIKGEADAIEKSTPKEAQKIVAPHTNAIREQTVKQDAIADRLDATEKRLSTTEQQTDDYQKAFLSEKQEKLKAIEREKAAKSEATKKLQDRYITVSIICFIGLIVSGALLFSGQAWAQAVAVCCGIGCALSIFLVQTVALIPWIVGGIVVIVVGIAVWQYLSKNHMLNMKTEENQKIVQDAASEKARLLEQHEKTISDLNEQHEKITTELAETVEGIKTYIPDEVRCMYFGQHATPGLVRGIQSPETRAVVAKVRKKIRKAPSVSNRCTPILATMVNPVRNVANPMNPVNPQSRTVSIRTNPSNETTIVLT